MQRVHPVRFGKRRSHGVAVRRDVFSLNQLFPSPISRRALRPSGRLTFVCWREPRDNPWLMVPLQAATNMSQNCRKLGPEDPGPFSFASEQRVQRILSEAGFSEIEMERCDLSLDVATGRGLDAAVETALEIGPASRALEGQPPALRAAAGKFDPPSAHSFCQRTDSAAAGIVLVVLARVP
jgi:hypothetical protein